MSAHTLHNFLQPCSSSSTGSSTKRWREKSKSTESPKSSDPESTFSDSSTLVSDSSLTSSQTSKLVRKRVKVRA